MKKYLIFDIQMPILMDCPVFEAINARKALDLYLKEKNIICKLKRGGKNPRFQVEQFEEERTIKYKKGRAVWFEISNPLNEKEI